MGMTAPKGMAAAPQAGLAALAQPAQAPKGMSSGNMAQVMARAKSMTDSQLADVLKGASLDVPQYVAMTEAMGRKSLRTAMDGQQAMAQAKQPSLKDKLMMGDQPQMQGIQQGMPQMPQQPVMAAEGGLMYADGGPIDMNMSANAGGGIAELPAPNMDAMTMAGGGIVAFSGEDNDQQIEDLDEQTRREREGTAGILGAIKDYGKALGRDTLTLPGRAIGGAYNTLNRGVRSLGADTPYIPESYFGGDSGSMAPHLESTYKRRSAAQAEKGKLLETPTIDSTPTQAEIDAIRATSAPPAGGPTKEQIDALNARPRVPGAGAGAPNEKAGLGATDEFKAYMDTVKKERADSMAELKGLSAKQREAALAAKSQGGGEALMGIARGILSKPGLAAGISAGLPDVMAASAASRKEQNALNQSANDYDINIAKSREAAAKGDMEAALQYKKLAQDAQYQQGMLAYHNASLNKPGETMQLLDAIRKPGESIGDAFARYTTMKKGELYSIDKATDDFNKIAGDKFSDQAKQLKALGITTPYQYQQYVLTQGGGGGNSFQSAANAEAQKRGI
jgi:hypothetical protein